MAGISNEQFLFRCIDYSDNGKINWTKVVEECGFNTKSAASMRYKRLKDKFDTITTTTAPDDTPDGEDGAETPRKKTPAKKGAPKKDSAKKADAKKRKLSEVEGDDVEGTPVKAEQEDDELV